MGWFQQQGQPGSIGAFAPQVLDNGQPVDLGNGQRPPLNTTQPVPGMPPKRLDNGQLPDMGNGQAPPQVPGMPPKRFDPSIMGPETQTPYVPLDSPRFQPGGDLYLDPSRIQTMNGGGQSTMDWRGVNDPRFGPGGVWDTGSGNRGNGQVINQPMLQQGALAQLGQTGFVDPGSLMKGITGAQQIGQMVNLRGPDGSTKAVPQDQAQHWISKGAVRF